MGGKRRRGSGRAQPKVPCKRCHGSGLVMSDRVLKHVQYRRTFARVDYTWEEVFDALSEAALEGDALRCWNAGHGRCYQPWKANAIRVWLEKHNEMPRCPVCGGKGKLSLALAVEAALKGEMDGGPVPV